MICVKMIFRYEWLKPGWILLLGLCGDVQGLVELGVYSPQKQTDVELSKRAPIANYLQLHADQYLLHVTLISLKTI